MYDSFTTHQQCLDAMMTKWWQSADN